MRVTYFHYIYKTPAPLVQVNEFAQAFRALGHELNIHAMDTEPQPSLKQQLKEGLKRYIGRYLHEANTLGKNLSYYQHERRIVESERPDLLVTRYKLYHASSAFVARRSRIPFVVWIDAPASYEQRKYLCEFVQIPGLAERIEKTVLAMADGAIVVSEETKRYLPASDLVNGRIAVIPNGVDTEKFSPSLDGRRLRERFPMTDPVVLGFVGSFSPWHGTEGLKFLLEFALSSFDNTCFLMVGDGPRRSELEAFIQSRGWDPRRVSFTGHVAHHEVPQCVAAMDICLLPYDQGSEGFYFSPLKLFEYLACKKAVLAARLGQIEEVLQDGVNGFLYTPDHQEEITAKLKQLILNPSLRERLAEAGRHTVLGKYTWNHTARAVEKLFEKVLMKRGTPAS